MQKRWGRVKIKMLIFVLCCALLSFNCKNQNNKTNARIEKQDQSKSKGDSIVSNKHFSNFDSTKKFDVGSNTICKKDSVINGSLFLMCRSCVIESFGNDFPDPIEFPAEDEGEGIILKSMESTLYLKLFQLPGGGKNQFMSFEIGLIELLTADEKKILRPTNIQNFITNSGLKVGLDKEKVIRIKGKPDKRRAQNNMIILEYNIDNIGDLFYNATAFFKNDLLIRYSFGYVNP